MVTLLQLQHIHIDRAGQNVLTLDCMDLKEGEILAVIGPNGAGKSTLLMGISGLLPLAQGQVIFQGKPVAPYRSLAYRRKLAMVMQEPLLIHGSVYANVATGLRFRGLKGLEVDRRVVYWLERLGIAHLKDRPAERLSGGEAQRVSLARALALQPLLLLMDEPFGALDSPTRQRLLEDLKSLLKETRTTTVFVTHDLDEALFLGNRVAVLMEGQLRQIGAPEDVFTAPSDRQVAGFVGVETILPGTVLLQEEGLLTVNVAGQQLQAIGNMRPGQAVLFCLRPEDITLLLPGSQQSSSARNHISGKVTRLVPQGPLLRVVVEGPVTVVALITRMSAREMDLEEGKMVTATFKASAVHVISRE